MGLSFTLTAGAGMGQAIRQIGADERVAFLTRFSPRPPDMDTLLIALAALAIASILFGLWKRRRRRSWNLHRDAPAVLALASFLWCGAFIGTGLAKHLFEPPLSVTREAYGGCPPAFIEKFSREIRGMLPEDAGVLLLNCADPRRPEIVNYFLYPRRVFYTQASSLSIPDPAAYLTPKIGEDLRSRGIEWILDLSPEAMSRGTASSLLRVPSSRGEEKERP